MGALLTAHQMTRLLTCPQTGLITGPFKLSVNIKERLLFTKSVGQNIVSYK